MERITKSIDIHVDSSGVDVRGHQNNPDWQNTRVIFRLSPSGQGTRLEFEHTGWRAKTKVYEMCDGGWSHFMNSLKSYMEMGSGTPHGAAA